MESQQQHAGENQTMTNTTENIDSNQGKETLSEGQQPSEVAATTTTTTGDDEYTTTSAEQKRKRGAFPDDSQNNDNGESSKRLKKVSEEDIIDNKKPGSTKEDTAVVAPTTEVSSQPTLTAKEITSNGKSSSVPSPGTKRKMDEQVRWRVNQMTEDYVELASNMMLLPTNHLGPYGYSDNQQGKGSGSKGSASYPLEHISSLGFLKSPLRRPTVIETWSPYEISLFEAGMGHFGKDFFQIHKVVQSKSTKEVIDFYYVWKKTSHYKVWKASYVNPAEVVSDDEYGSTPVKAKPSR